MAAGLLHNIICCIDVHAYLYRVVTRMDTPKPGWTPYVVYTTEILSFLHNRNIISNGKRSLKNQIILRLEPGSFAS